MRNFFYFQDENENVGPLWHINHDIKVSRPKSHNIGIPRPKNRDMDFPALKQQDIEKRRQLSHDIVIPRHFFRGQKATTSRFQD